MLSKHLVLRFVEVLLFLVKLFSSHIYCIPKTTSCFNWFNHQVVGK